MKNLYKTFLISALLMASGAFGAQGSVKEEIIVGMPTSLTDWALMGKTIMSYGLGDIFAITPNETKEHEARRRSLEADLDFIIEALFRSKLHENVQTLWLSEEVATYQVECEVQNPKNIIIEINPLWFKRLRAFDKWAYVAQAIIDAYDDASQSFYDHLSKKLVKLSYHTRIRFNADLTSLEELYMDRFSAKDIMRLKVRKSSIVDDFSAMLYTCDV